MCILDEKSDSWAFFKNFGYIAELQFYCKTLFFRLHLVEALLARKYLELHWMIPHIKSYNIYSSDGRPSTLAATLVASAGQP